jgi:glutathione S-transferase
MIIYDSNLPAPNPVTVRLFVLERGGLEIDAVTIDIENLENRGKAYRDAVNARGELPALRLDNGQVITEITAVCAYLDEVAKGGRSLFGEAPEERAVTRMWTRRMYLEICQPLVNWWRNGEDTVDFYRGNRLPVPAARLAEKLAANQGLNRLDDELEGKAFICGDQISMADILLYAFMVTMSFVTPWLKPSGRKNVAAWYERMGARETCQKALESFKEHVSV